MGQGRGTSVRPPVHPRPKQTQPAQIHRAWVCGSVGLWVFVLFFLRNFFFFLAVLRAFGALHHMTLQGYLGVEAEAGVGGSQRGGTREEVGAVRKINR